MSENMIETNTEEPRKLKITVSGEKKKKKTTLLRFIKFWLERDYEFRRLFYNAKIKLEEKVEDLPDEIFVNEVPSTNETEK